MDDEVARTRETLGEIKGLLGAFISRFENHEVEDREGFKNFDARMERNESRAEARATQITDALSRKLEEFVVRFEKGQAETREGLTKLNNQNFFQAGGIRYLLVVGGVVLSLVSSLANFVADHWPK